MPSSQLLRRLKRLVLHRDKKASQLLGLHAQQTEVRNEIDDLQQKIAGAIRSSRGVACLVDAVLSDMRRENRELYAKVKEIALAPQEVAGNDGAKECVELRKATLTQAGWPRTWSRSGRATSCSVT